jgi:hypothetical protein
MPKKLSLEDESTLQTLKERLLLTIRFIEDVQDFPSGAELRNIVESAAAKRDLRSLRLMSREVDAMTLSLAPHEGDGLEALLRQRLGVDRDAERAEWARHVAAAIKRGTVASEKERRRLEDYAEMLEATGGDPAEIDAVRRLLRTG